jgi:predicted SprT family Zn-dependent metalloprotease
MDGRFFAFQMRQAKAPGKTVDLECQACPEKETRPKVNLYTGHVFDMKCTYVCKKCRGEMKVISEG